ncbi:coiled-coil domain-containing protein 171 [Rhinophrynus dorsalis]
MTFVSQNNPTANEVKRSQIYTHEKEEQIDLCTISELRYKLNKTKNENIELLTKHSKELTAYESQFIKLRSKVEQGEVIRQSLEYDLAVAKKQYGVERMALEEEKANSIRLQEQFKAQIEELQQKMYSVEHIFQTAQHSWHEAQKKFESDIKDRDYVIQNCKKEEEILVNEKNNLEILLQKQSKSVQELQQKLHEMELQQSSHMDTLRHQKSELGYCHEREERLKLELETANQRVKQLEENIEAERAAHLESKFNSEVIQLRIRDLEESLQVEKASLTQTASDLDMMKERFKEVEAAYNLEKCRADETTEKLKKSEQDFCFLVNQMKADIDQKDRLITEMSGKLKHSEESCNTMEQDLALTKKHQFSLEESWNDNMRELQSLLDSFTVSSQCTSGICKDKFKPAGFTAVLETLRHILTDFQSRIEATSNELEVTKRVSTRMNEELEASKQMIQALCNNLEKTRFDLGAAEKELCHLHTKCTDQEGQIGIFQKDLEKAQHSWEQEKLRVLECENEIQKLTRVHKQDAEEKLTFLHSLYQRLVAGCVLLKQPESMLGSFSWSELCVVLQENVDILISDLSRANEKVSHLECVCKNKTDVLMDLQKNHEDSLNKLAEQVKAQESCWQKQRRDLEQHYSVLLGEAQARAQKCQSLVEKSKDKIAVFEKTKDQVALENVHLKNLLINSEKDHKSLLAACALMAGALYPLYNRTCLLAAQRNFLQNQINTYVEAEKEIRTLVQALSEKCHFRSIIHVFRKGVIAVLAANRLHRLGRSCRSLFAWAEDVREGIGIMVCTGGDQSIHRMPSEQDEQMRCHEALQWFTSSNLLTSVVRSMSDLLGVLNMTDPKSQSRLHLIQSSARNSFSMLMKKLSFEMQNTTVSTGSYAHYLDPDCLVQRLALGLQKLNSQAKDKRLTRSIPVLKCIAALKKQIFEFTQRLHKAEVERRSLRLELFDFKEKMTEFTKNTDNTERLKEQIKKFKQSKVVPYEKFKSACEELNNALLREQQAQILLNEQSQQLQELSYRIELHATEEAEKDQTLSEAVKSISEAKIDLRRKDQSLRLLNRQVAQLEQDKRRLEEGIRDAESALRMAAKDKEILTNHMKLIDVSFQKVKDQISLSRSTHSDFTFHLPKLHPELFPVDGQLGGSDFVACQSMIRSFMDVYQLACLKAAAVEREIASHQKHVVALKSELQTACLREYENLSPTKYNVNIPLTMRTDVLSDKRIVPDFLPLQTDPDLSHNQMNNSLENSRFQLLPTECSSIANQSSPPKRALRNTN